METVRRVGATDTRPLIAVTTSEVRTAQTVRPTRHGERPQHEMALGLTYLRALEAAGGLPVVVPPLSIELVDPLLDRFDALCMSGGPDLDPVAYGERRHERTGPVVTELDTFELALARAADARGMPILAICRGMQVLNVARVGTLHQHLPDVVGETIRHRQSEAGSRLTHWVSLEPETRLARTLERRRAKVNSFHHQGVARLGHNLVVAGRASDGTIEGVEATDRDFVVGVQWHAESLISRREQAALFAAFVDRARGPDAGASHLRAA